MTVGRRTSHGCLAAWAVLTAASFACGSGPADAGRAPAPGGDRPRAWFVDATADAGLDFRHVNGMSGQWYLAEIMGAGVALLDYDNDGDLDVYAVQGGPLERGRAPGVDAAGGDRLFRNDLTAGKARFADVTVASGLTGRGYGMGVATGDIDNDGWTDLLVMRLGGLALLRNTGRGTFTDVTARSGLRAPSWGVSATFVDFDRDGWLDVYLANYLVYSVATDTDCFAGSGAPAYCSPRSYRPEPDRLYRNRGDGTFDDVTAAARVAGEAGPGLGVVALDANGDDWLDLYVANDGTPNVLWINQKDGTFADDGLLSGTALSGAGRPEGSMGVDAGDVDNDGDEDLVMTHIAGEGHNVYRSLGGGAFVDASIDVGLGNPSLPYTGFGGAWVDVDNDGWLDLVTVNGAIQPIESQAREGDPFPLRQQNQAFRNEGGTLRDATAQAGEAFRAAGVGRGLAVGDVDNDGDADLVTTANNGRLRLLLNTAGDGQRWVGIRAVSRPGGRDMLGAKVVVRTGDGRTLVRRVRTDGSYASARDPRVLVGLGSWAGLVSVQVTWPDGRTGVPQELAASQWHTISAEGVR